MANNGVDYEAFVKSLQQAIFKAESVEGLKNIEIERRKILKDDCGIEREFDLYWEFELGGFTYKTVIECKDYASSITIDKIDAFIGKLNSFHELKGIYATKTGYQSGAEKKASTNKIDLLIARKPNDSDWVDEEGRPLIKKVCVELQFQFPAIIREFSPKVTEDVLKKMGGLTTLQFKAPSNQIFINDGDCEISFEDLVNKLTMAHKDESGVFEDVVEFKKEGELISPSNSFKIVGYTVKYEIKPPNVENIEVDASDAMYGVIEYLSKGKKTLIWKNGKIEKRIMGK